MIPVRECGFKGNVHFGGQWGNQTRICVDKAEHTCFTIERHTVEGSPVFLFRNERNKKKPVTVVEASNVAFWEPMDSTDPFSMLPPELEFDAYGSERLVVDKESSPPPPPEPDEPSNPPPPPFPDRDLPPPPMQLCDKPLKKGGTCAKMLKHRGRCGARK